MRAKINFSRVLVQPCIILFMLMVSVGDTIAQQSGKDQPPVNTVNVTPLKWNPEGIVITLKDDLKHPAFSWPLSALQYQVDFGSDRIMEKELNLVDELTGKDVPFQLNDLIVKNNYLQKATLTFLSGLPSGTQRLFQFARRKRNKKQEVTDGISVRVEKTTDSYLISNGKIRIEIPSLQATKISAPIKRYGNNVKWMAYGEIPASLRPAKMSVVQLNVGPIQASFLINYEFAGNKQYKVTIKLTAGMEFAELEEEMCGFDVKENEVWNLIWNDIALDHRYASTRAEKIDGKQKGSYDNFAWEPMEGLPSDPEANKHPLLDYDQQNAKDGKLPIRISPYDNWMSWWRLPSAAFWSEKENTTIGLFIKDTEKWDDGLYALWGSKENLNIYFHWNNKVLDYTFPLVTGTRSTALAIYTHQKDKTLIDQSSIPLAYIDELRRWHGWMPLNKVKNWVLNYESPETGYPRYFKPENATSALTLARLENSLSNNLKTIGTGGERVNGPNPVSSRIYYDVITPAFDLNASQMTAAQYKRLRSWYLFVSYLYMDEALMPVRTMLSGHPNFLSDIKGIPGLTAFLFPKHPESRQMAEHYEKSVRLNFNYHIRPDVPSWGALGGRWTENLATYTWAALTPAIRTSYLLQHSYDGKNRILQPGVSMYGNWLLNAISSPLTAKNNRRVYPPQGAHAHAYGEGSPNALRILAQDLSYYNPILSENLLWFTKAEDSPFESTNEKNKAWGEILLGDWKNNKGTNPHLKSEKFTGYGFVLRSAFGTKDEMYVNLQQIDEGPNYRWGRAAMGGNGVIYYYAQGKRYSHNGSEDVGDGPFGDTERATNFGVKKAGGYRSIGPYRSVGRNELTEPLYDFGFAQFASIKGNKDIANDYRSRSVMQSGADYIVIFDDVANAKTEGRFSWFVGVEDDFPGIYQLKPGAPAVPADIKPSKSNYHKDPEVLPTKGRYYDGKGSFLTVVTHKPEIKTSKTDFGCVVKKGNITDLVFRDDKIVDYHKDRIGFTGTAGFIRQDGDNFAAALFSGSHIEVPELRISLPVKNQSAISLEKTDGSFSGIFQSRQPQTVTFITSKPKLAFFMDGVAVNNTSTVAGQVQITFPAGKHTWQWTDKGLRPVATEILSSQVKKGSVSVSWRLVPGATSYQLQLSKDGGSSWEIIDDQMKATSAETKGLKNGTKVHLRVLAHGSGGNSEPCNDYPVYVTDLPPHAPEGLVIDLSGPKTMLVWGKILGAGGYKLYRRVKASSAAVFKAVYEGNQTSFMDQKSPDGVIYEYVVTAVNGNGESKYSIPADTDPASFLNWEPKGKKGFRRDTEDHENGFLEFNPFIEDKKPVLTYPEIK